MNYIMIGIFSNCFAAVINFTNSIQYIVMDIALMFLLLL